LFRLLAAPVFVSFVETVQKADHTPSIDQSMARHQVYEQAEIVVSDVVPQLCIAGTSCWPLAWPREMGRKKSAG
jgi:hypothetical protein